EDDVRRLAAELERDALDRPGRARHDAPTYLGRPGEADLCDIRMLDEPLPDDRALPDEHVDDAVGNPRVVDQLREAQCRQRRQLRRLEHDRVAAGERRAELPARDVEWEVPRHDQPDDAERLAERDVDPAGDGDLGAAVLVDRTGVEVEDAGDHRDLGAGARDRLADVPPPAPGPLLP